ncbi:hypothetical protein KM043_007507 [Ampulex compressa]|nr:hypothetical protein KM043_007507 [Ampulex compressa]
MELSYVSSGCRAQTTLSGRFSPSGEERNWVDRWGKSPFEIPLRGIWTGNLVVSRLVENTRLWALVEKLNWEAESGEKRDEDENETSGAVAPIQDATDAV